MKPYISAFPSIAKTLTGLGFVLSFSFANAAISYTAISNDANSGINLARGVYTHALDMVAASAPTGALINGLQFVGYTTTLNTAGANGFQYTAIPGAVNENAGSIAPNVTAGTGLYTMLSGLFYNSNVVGTTPTANDARFVLSGLVAGQTYELRIYTRGWDAAARGANFIFNNGGSGPFEQTGILNQNDASGANPGQGFAANQAYYINYSYTATGTSLTVDIDQQNVNQSWHLYGITNQAVPEPSSLLLGALGTTGFLSLRRRKA